MKTIRLLITLTSLWCILSCNQWATAQSSPSAEVITRADSLRGTSGPERAWWNLLHYEIAVTPNIATKSIAGTNIITFEVLTSYRTMQIDLQQPMELTAAVWNKKSLLFTREENVYHIQFPENLKPGNTESLKLTFAGTPKEANARGYEGWAWLQDEKGQPWVTVSDQKTGASMWLPNKDQLADKPDKGIIMHITTPDSLVGIGNGKFQSKKPHRNGTATYTWQVSNPIAPYSIIPYIGKYVNWSETYAGLAGDLACDYWVLTDHLEKGKTHFAQVASMLQAFEFWAGPYPFYEDGYKLVETPYFGLEHQSNIAYGNKFMNGYKGKDLSATGWGLTWDYIIVHESAHEWFGNSLTCDDVAYMWINEAFTTYMETLYVSALHGVDAGNAYSTGLRNGIANQTNIEVIPGVNRFGSQDMYFKGQAMIHIIRQLLGDISFRELLLKMQQDFRHQSVSGPQIEKYISDYARQDLSKVFDQYLRSTSIPRLEYRRANGKISYRWANCVAGFQMPVKVRIWGKDLQWITPTENWQSLPDTTDAPTIQMAPEYQSAIAKELKTNPGSLIFSVDPNFYVDVIETTASSDTKP